MYNQSNVIRINYPLYIINWNNITYLSSGVMSKQNLLSMESDILRIQVLSLKLSVDCVDIIFPVAWLYGIMQKSLPSL